MSLAGPNPIRPCAVLALLLLGGAAGWSRAGGEPAAVPVAVPSLCRAGERVWLSATLVGSREMISLCSDAASPDARGLQFRRGRPGAVSFAYPRVPGDPVRDFVIRRYTRPRTTYLKLEFRAEGREYAILESFVAEGVAYHGATLRVRPGGDGAKSDERALRLHTEPLAMMALERHVRSEPFNE